MKFKCYVKDDDISTDFKNQFTKKLVDESKGKFQESASREAPELVVSIGGDGTFLDAFSTYGVEPYYVGVNTGTVGFYTDWLPEEMEGLVERLIKIEEMRVRKFPILQCSLQLKSGCKERLVLNELMIRDKDTYSLNANVFIDEQLFETFSGGSVLVTTPTGSTAYAKSLGGCVYPPTFKAMQLVKVGATINNRTKCITNPILISEGQELKIKVGKRKIFVSMDREHLNTSELESVTCNIYKKPLKLLDLKGVTYWERIADTFL